jgi:autotransporter-associated beta strand protein
VLLTSIFLGLLGLGSAQAQTTNLWIRNSASLNHWTNATAWSPTNPKNAIDSVAIFGVVNTANRTITNIGTALNLGRLMFTNTNSFTGNLTLNAGELRINGDGRLGNAYNDLNFNGGLLRVQTNFTMPASRVLTMQAGGRHHLQPDQRWTFGLGDRRTARGRLPVQQPRVREWRPAHR